MKLNYDLKQLISHKKYRRISQVTKAKSEVEKKEKVANCRFSIETKAGERPA